jgi:hypothetical protein
MKILLIIFLPILGYGQMMDVVGDTVPRIYKGAGYPDSRPLGVYIKNSDITDTIRPLTKCEIRGHVWMPHIVTTLVHYPNEPRLVDTDSMTVMIYSAKYSFEECARCGEIKKTKASDEIHKVLWRKK